MCSGLNNGPPKIMAQLKLTFLFENIYSPVYKVDWNEGDFSTIFIYLKCYSPLKWKEYEVSYTLQRSLNNCLGFESVTEDK